MSMVPEQPAKVDMVQVPRTVLVDLIAVALYVSLGRSAVGHQPDGAPYPDAVARRALGALDSAIFES